MSALSELLNTFRHAAVSEREKGTYFEELIMAYLRNEATYRDLYSDVWTYAEWATIQGLDGRDIGIDLVGALEDIDLDVEMEFAHALEDGLAGLLIGGDTK